MEAFHKEWWLSPEMGEFVSKHLRRVIKLPLKLARVVQIFCKVYLNNFQALKIVSGDGDFFNDGHSISPHLMRVLLIITHADPYGHSASHKFAYAALEQLTSDGHEVRVLDLVKTAFIKCASPDDFLNIKNPSDFHYADEQVGDNLVKEITEQQENVKWCSHMLIFGPMWFFRYPACFYAYFERVFSNGFGYGPTQYVDSGPMKNKYAMCVVTCGNNRQFIDPKGGLGSIEGLFYHTLSGHLRYCGFTVLRSQAFCEIGRIRSKEYESEIISKWKLAIKNLERRPAIPFYPMGPSDPNGLNELQYLAGLPELTLEEAALL